MHLKFKKFWLILGLGSVALVLFLSLAPDLPDTGVPEGMKVGHVLAYSWLMLWFAQIYRSTTARYRLAITFCLMGIGLEYVQGLTDYRGFEYSDMLDRLRRCRSWTFALLYGIAEYPYALGSISVKAHCSTSPVAAIFTRAV